MEFKDVIDDLSKDITGATKKVFEIMASMNVEQRQASLSDKTEISADVICIITIAGKYHGIIGLFGSKSFTLKTVSNMLKEEQKILTMDIVSDAMGEITNMIAGDAKTALTGKYGEMSLSVPIVMTGNDMIIAVAKGPTESKPSVFCTTGDPWLLIDFTCDNEEFNVGLLLKET
jgi:chemotaxis protein CheX